MGAPANNTNGVDSGQVTVYEYNGVDEWEQLGNAINGDSEDSYLGRALSFNSAGTRLAVGGAPNTLGDGAPAMGYVRVYDNSEGGDWTILGGDINGAMAGDRFGRAVSLSNNGSVLAIGGPINNDSAGHVRIYTYSGGNWSQQGDDIVGDAGLMDLGDQLGYAVALSGEGNILVSGGPANSANGFQSGHTRVFINNTVLSVEDNTFSANLRLYPNPSSNGTATIALPDTSASVHVSVYDVQGKLVHQEARETAADIVLNTVSYPKGIYFITLATSGKKATLKMLVD